LTRTSRPVSVKLGTKHPWVKGIQSCSIKGQVLFKGKITATFKNLKNYWARKAQIYMKAS
jgi:hypothetical protein